LTHSSNIHVMRLIENKVRAKAIESTLLRVEMEHSAQRKKNPTVLALREDSIWAGFQRITFSTSAFELPSHSKPLSKISKVVKKRHNVLWDFSLLLPDGRGLGSQSYSCTVVVNEAMKSSNRASQKVQNAL